MLAITYHGNNYWSLHYRQCVYRVSDLLTAATILGIAHNPQALQVLAKIFDTPIERTVLLDHPAVCNTQSAGYGK